MSWIRSVAPELASGPLQRLYQRLASRGPGGRVRAAWLGQGLDPGGLEATVALEEALTGDPAPLSRVQSELIAVVVAATNGCAYCVAHHGPALARALGDETLARAVALDYREANLVARDRVLLDYAVALTCEPSERTADDVERVREYGLDDAAILKATEIAAYYNLANRIVCALGVELEPGVAAWEFGSQR